MSIGHSSILLVFFVGSGSGSSVLLVFSAGSVSGSISSFLSAFIKLLDTSETNNC